MTLSIRLSKEAHQRLLALAKEHDLNLHEALLLCHQIGINRVLAFDFHSHETWKNDRPVVGALPVMYSIANWENPNSEETVTEARFGF